MAPTGIEIDGSGAAGAARQGASVSLSADGNTALIGGPGDNNILGATWVFTRNNGIRTQQGAKLLGIDASGQANQGSSVALAG